MRVFLLGNPREHQLPERHEIAQSLKRERERARARERERERERERDAGTQGKPGLNSDPKP